MPLHNVAVAFSTAAVLTGCAGSSLERHAGQGPRLDLREYLDGPLTASGMFFDYAGRPSLAFTVDMEGSWVGNTGILTERFAYADGRTDVRTWSIRFIEGTTSPPPPTMSSGRPRASSAATPPA